MNRGKFICKELKTVRKRIAEENNIPLEIKECTYEGPCRGTCPRCEAEVRYLENSLAHRLKMGKVATIAGLTLGLASCGGGQAERTDTLLRSTSSSTSPSLGEEQMPEVPEGPETNIEVPEVGELEVVGDVAEIPPPPPPYEDDGTETEMIQMEEGETGEMPVNALVGLIVEDEPEFPGGMEAMYKFLQDNIRYPRLALENNITGKVYVAFVVETDGSITNPKILRDIGGGCGQEAIRLVKMMPKWKPGKQRDKVVRVQYNLPVNFSISEDKKSPNAPTQQMRVDGVKVIVK